MKCWGIASIPLSGDVSNPPVGPVPQVATTADSRDLWVTVAVLIAAWANRLLRRKVVAGCR